MSIFILICFFQCVLVSAFDANWTKIKCIRQFKSVHLDYAAKLIATESLKPRVIGGSKAKPHSFPFYVGLVIEEKHFCAGSLISEYYVLTAAHCIKDVSRVTVVLGADKIDKYETSQVSIIVTQSGLIKHEEFDNFTNSNDIALIELPYPTTFNKDIKSIPLDTNTNAEYSSAIVSGWGRNCIVNNTSYLKKTEVDILEYDVCYNLYEVGNTEAQICSTVGGCNGDGGGPLVSDGKQIGILSFGNDNCDLPSVSIRVSYYIDWILKNIKK